MMLEKMLLEKNAADRLAWFRVATNLQFVKKKMQYLFMAEQYFIVYMYHIFFIHSPVNGHLGCFNVLTIINSATMNIRVHGFFQLIVTN